MPRDFLDQLIADWRRQRPDLDPSGMEVCGRILRIADRLKQRLGERLRHLGLGVGGY
ncbi:MAG: MarR family transcriptional regulator, partial [Gemmatimonadetes bacterium]|nr:MarR family transcriptional regulator [Gemmatimonadota bacterium]NIT65701.1 MarR family transcriptional regulator [Gemmatimonadota bacterium]NIW74173.1 MarR family transcriptional regulator [Gemmatimonadota bacterium]NIY34279.1 MarR family transcriptional regulator [Gemmatimonadota bacterium]